MSSTEAAFSGEQLVQLAGPSPLWRFGCAPKDCCGFLGLSDTGDIWNVQQHGCHELNREQVSIGSTDQLAHLIVHIYLVDAHSLDSHKVRGEETTTRRRERRKDPERMKLKRATKVQRCEGHSSAQVVAEGSVTAPREYVSAAKPVEREPSTV